MRNLTGKPAYHGPRFQLQALHADLDDAYQRLAECSADQGLIAIARRCLNKRPSQRYATSEELAGALADHLQSVQSRLQEERIAKERQAVRTIEEKRRRRWQMGVALAVLLLIFGSAAGGFYAYQQSEKERFRLQSETDELRQKKAFQRESAKAALDDGARFLREGNDPAAETAFGRAEEILRDDGAKDQLARLNELRRMMLFVKRLEDIRLNASTWISTEGGGEFDHASALRDYSVAFRNEGYDVLNDNVETLAKRIRQSVIADRLVAALDAWSETADSSGELTLRNRVLNVAQRADTNPRNAVLKEKLRNPAKWVNRKQFIELAHEENVTRLTPELLLMLQGLLPQEERIVLLKRGITAYPTAFWLHLTLGNRLPESEYGLRIGSFRSALAIRPEAIAAWNNLGMALADSGDLTGAIDAYKQALQLDPKFIFAHNNLGNALQKSGDIPGAIAAYKHAMKLDSKYVTPYIGLGNALQDSDDIPGAIAAFNNAIELDPKRAGAYYNLGNALRKSRDNPGAIAAYKKAIKLDPKHARANFKLGNALYDSDDIPGALRVSIASYKKAIKLDPNYARAYNNLGVVLRDSGDIPGAIADYKQAIKLDPKFVSAHINLGIALRNFGEFNSSMTIFNKASRLVHNDRDLSRLIEQGITTAKRSLHTEQRIKNILSGKDNLAGEYEALVLANFLIGYNKSPFDALYFYHIAFAKVPKLMPQHRYNAACSAVLGANLLPQHWDSVTLAYAATLRNQAHAWLYADLKTLRKQPNAKILQRWKTDPDLASIRDPESVGLNFPSEERKRWQQLWADVDALLAKVRDKPNQARP